MSSVPAGHGSGPDAGDHVSNKSIVVPNRVVTLASDSFEKKEHSWYVRSQIPTDLSIQVEDKTFNVHKYPLVSKCGYIARLELQPSASDHRHDLKLENFPGGAETLETILIFCYGLPLDLNPNNIAPLRCASEYLDMTEEFEDGNLISKTEAFITFVILASWKDTVTVLKSCENLSPWAENLQIVRRCCDSLAWKASRDTSSEDHMVNDEGLLYDDVATLRIDHFTRFITTIRARGAKPETVGKLIMNYADKWLPGMDGELEGLRGYGFGRNELQFNIHRGRIEGGVGYKEHRTIIESLVSMLPSQFRAVSCQFLLKLLKTAMMYSASPALISDLEKRVSVILEDANVNDLLIPNYKNEDQGKAVNSPEHCTMHNVDVVQRILEYFCMHEQQQQQQQQQKSWKSNITKLLDNYLAEIAKDPNLSVTNFQVLAESLPESARTCDDGLYRAIDTFLKTHPTLPEHDRRRLCKIMTCEKLSLDACMHAAQNDRLPLRTIVQVLFSEQVKLRMAMQEKEPEQRGDSSEQEENQFSTNTEIKNLRAELESIKNKMSELQNDYSELQQEYEKLGSNKQRKISGWGISWRMIKKSLQTKHDGNETGDGQERPSSARQRTSLRRRVSLP